MRIEGSKIVYEREDCYCANYASGPGTEFGTKPCEVCHGTGKGKRGKPGGCRECHGLGRNVDMQSRVPCARCKGNYKGYGMEDRYSFVPRGPLMNEILARVPLRLVRQDRAQTFNEAYLGLGSLFSVSDYGRAWETKSDAALLDKVREEIRTSIVQVTHIVNDEDELPSDFIIVVQRGGYSVRALHPVTA